ncbi:hypothetical protein BT96DRAFT_951056 [Gymnopus androsaceus JB14]|uniref:Uncharacterized protein n=1 Tax=Gymnopus androsaceus JB14 TaxID=1447944 RepID=A0A6A4GEJ2_9AGAR|nr:hypothetical protein BT96DRAFT_951056 [Gymnopus androsaceus JB14]
MSSYSPVPRTQNVSASGNHTDNNPSAGRLISLNQGYQVEPGVVTPPNSPVNEVTRDKLRLYSDSGVLIPFDPSLFLANSKGYSGSAFSDSLPIPPTSANSIPSNLPYFASFDLSIPNDHLLPDPVTRHDLLYPIAVPGGLRSQFPVPFYYFNPQYTSPPYNPFAIEPLFNVSISLPMIGCFIEGSTDILFPPEDNGHVLNVFLRHLATLRTGKGRFSPHPESLNFIQYHAVVNLRPVALPHFIALKDQVRGEVSSLAKLAMMVDPDTLPTDSKEEVVVAGYEKYASEEPTPYALVLDLYSDNGCEASLYVPIHNFSPTYDKTWRWIDSEGAQQQFTSLVCSHSDELEWNAPSTPRTFSILGPVHDCRRNKWDSYIEDHGTTFLDRAVRDSFERFDLSFRFVYANTDYFLLGDEFVCLEFYEHVWRSDPDLTYAEIERGVVAEVAPERYRAHRGCISSEVFIKKMGSQEERELIWMMDPIMFTKLDGPDYDYISTISCTYAEDSRRREEDEAPGPTPGYLRLEQALLKLEGLHIVPWGIALIGSPYPRGIDFISNFRLESFVDVNLYASFWIFSAVAFSLFAWSPFIAFMMHRKLRVVNF